MEVVAVLNQAIPRKSLLHFVSIYNKLIIFTVLRYISLVYSIPLKEIDISNTYQKKKKIDPIFIYKGVQNLNTLKLYVILFVYLHIFWVLLFY